MIKREMYIAKIIEFIDKDIIKVLTGIRRSGKSVILSQIQDYLLDQGIPKQNILSINFESNATDFISSVSSTYNHIKTLSQNTTGRLYLFFDEIQELSNWEKLVNSCMIDFDCDIYITGSNANLLSTELATYLAGRYVEIKIYPFSFAEACLCLPNMNKDEAFEYYLKFGGMPFIYNYGLEAEGALHYLSDIYDSVVLKDIVARNGIRDVEQFKRILNYFISSVGNTFSATSISKYLKSEHRSISNETLYNYIDYCKNACLIDFVKREDVIGKSLLTFQEKIYLIDHGIRQAIFESNIKNINQVLENIIYMELLRRGFNVTVGKNGENEIDFVAIKNDQRVYYQVTYLLANEDTVEREFGAFLGISDNYPKVVLSMDKLDFSRDGYIHKNIIDFLLEK